MSDDPTVQLATAEAAYRKHKTGCLPCLLPTEAAGVGDRCATDGPALQREIFRLRDLIGDTDRDARNDFADWGAERVRDGVL